MTCFLLMLRIISKKIIQQKNDRKTLTTIQGVDDDYNKKEISE
jgi:translation initiation factor 1 (eIF-1/SUI1)